MHTDIRTWQPRQLRPARVFAVRAANSFLVACCLTHFVGVPFALPQAGAAGTAAPRHRGDVNNFATIMSRRAQRPHATLLRGDADYDAAHSAGWAAKNRCEMA
jgi:hypothetical protein